MVGSESHLHSIDKKVGEEGGLGQEVCHHRLRDTQGQHRWRCRRDGNVKARWEGGSRQDVGMEPV